MLPHVEQHLASGNLEAAYAAASGAVEIGERFADADLVACARHLQGRVLLRQRRTTEGSALLDDAMVLVTTGELSPLLTGLICCSVIEACQQVHALAAHANGLPLSGAAYLVLGTNRRHWRRIASTPTSTASMSRLPLNWSCEPTKVWSWRCRLLSARVVFRRRCRRND